MHADQLTISERTVRELVDSQFPQWRDAPVRAVDSTGTVNAIFRIGDNLAARFRLRVADADDVLDQLEREARAATQLAAASRFPTPEPVAIGRPGLGYPLPWSVQTWVPGATASEEVATSEAFAADLADFIFEVRAIPTGGRTFSGRGRGGDLPSHDEWMAKCFEESKTMLDVAPLKALWQELRNLPRGGPDLMCHKDLIPSNLLVADGRLAGVLDVGGLEPADPALDLVVAWHALEEGPRQVLRTRLDCTALQWERGRAWALEQAMGLVWYYVESNPPMARLGRRTLMRLTCA
ncbi:aminoglycoside phosphotransferase family protein [Nocardioides sp.]|uniref:aminoglycoside phosphotransferase family protein n=1 Tax=Nocardioides sp. TaxID=35761 RepID=UPI003511A0D8